MGSVVYDFYNPEFILLGRVDEEAEIKVKEFYKTITDATVFTTSLENAELIKVSYNTDRKSTRLNSSHSQQSRMPSSA